MMEKMMELYQKVAGDKTLQEKFGEILNNAEQAGQKATDSKLVEFAKEAGFDVSAEEIREFFNTAAEKGSGELSDSELDSVAGGKLNMDKVGNSVATYGAGCLEGSLTNQIFKGNCLEYFQQ
jgi:predicted ribosomally synthesized peptide with nif11-like leader